MRAVLSIAGSDSGGGAGIQADTKAIQACGAYALTVITSVTAQNTLEVTRAFDLPADVVTAQLEAVFADFEIAALKTGMLSSEEIVRAVAALLRQRLAAPLVVDPVMYSKSGFRLLGEAAGAALRTELLPMAALVTPNLPEAEALSGVEVKTREDARRAARIILQSGCRAVLVKGGHFEEGDAADLLYDGERFREFSAPRIHTRHTHGTGCTYSAAIAAYLGRGFSLEEAVGRAKDYVSQAIRHAPGLGQGHGPVHHFYFLEGHR